ncbi:hypothetical protein DYB31_014483 [Aphanomyces astaci]|uniref:Calponin-homology (CH) domain-containing protein n=1 Tax=Aphanomyces astaci TaxID=112090 RepID=A0A397FG70_APHAT|nr:hypothetical protein DYB31_014483 [Aphanomyces astaci]
MAIRKLKARGIGRFELLSWLNEFLETDYTNARHVFTLVMANHTTTHAIDRALADGIAYCQVFDILYPGKVPLQQVNFHAQVQPEYERNLKLLQRALDACGVQKEMAIKKLVKGVFQEHFEFLHWVHDYVHRTYPDAMRLGNAYARREQILQKSGDAAVNLNLIPKHSWVHTSAALQHATCIVRSLQPPPAKGAPLLAKSSGPTKTKARVETKQTTAASKNKLQRTQALLHLRLRQCRYCLEQDTLQADVSAILSERKHYFDLLREVEVRGILSS